MEKMSDEQFAEHMDRRMSEIATKSIENGWLQCQLEACRRLRALGMVEAADVVLSLVRED